jgi:hypothetical protein
MAKDSELEEGDIQGSTLETTWESLVLSSLFALRMGTPRPSTQLPGEKA